MELRMKDGGSGVSVSDAAFGAAFNEPLVHQVVTAYMAGGRRGTKAQKSRAEVAGGGKKPWRQKGTGRARAGTIRSPLWRGGGTHFAARPRDYSQKVNKKMYRGAMRAILSELVRQDRLTVVESFAVDAPKTRDVADKLAGLGASGRSVIVVDGLDDNIRLGARNLEDVHCCDAAGVDPVSLVAADTVVLSVGALRRLEGWLA